MPVSEFTVQNTGILTMLKDISSTVVLRHVFVAFLMDILVVYSSKMIVLTFVPTLNWHDTK